MSSSTVIYCRGLTSDNEFNILNYCIRRNASWLSSGINFMLETLCEMTVTLYDFRHELPWKGFSAVLHNLLQENSPDCKGGSSTLPFWEALWKLHHLPKKERGLWSIEQIISVISEKWFMVEWLELLLYSASFNGHVTLIRYSVMENFN